MERRSRSSLELIVISQDGLVHRLDGGGGDHRRGSPDDRERANGPAVREATCLRDPITAPFYHKTEEGSKVQSGKSDLGKSVKLASLTDLRFFRAEVKVRVH